ncbi:MAG: hypothetical protein M1826_005410 [Phylliscum demangeonii]|nr:MAG: hypothetical protein M1826_005410 [Phylliscum demangeonii]
MNVQARDYDPDEGKMDDSVRARRDSQFPADEKRNIKAIRLACTLPRDICERRLCQREGDYVTQVLEGTAEYLDRLKMEREVLMAMLTGGIVLAPNGFPEWDQYIASVQMTVQNALHAVSETVMSGHPAGDLLVWNGHIGRVGFIIRPEQAPMPPLPTWAIALHPSAYPSAYPLFGPIGAPETPWSGGGNENAPIIAGVHGGGGGANRFADMRVAPDPWAPQKLYHQESGLLSERVESGFVPGQDNWHMGANGVGSQVYGGQENVPMQNGHYAMK